MKTNFFKLSLLVLVLFTASCSSDDDKNTTPEVVVTTKVSDLNAPQSGGQGQPVTGAYTKFSFSENKVVTNDNWDIAFRGTFIIVNGGAKVNVDDAGEPARTGSGAISIVSNTFAAVTAFPAAATFKQDAATVYAIPGVSGQGWYNYANTIISPIAGKVIVVKTHDGKYAKFEILSYYKGAPVTPTAESTSRYYTFNFAYQANSTTTF
ncbi:heme-binding HmuY-like protein [Flavobacterium sp. 90]|uniref:HmuY family protein n=1 Tax=unclassified Flavobacterium TaxID=196869 RepID=UPI000EAD0171|nr:MULTISPECIES: HmuY family protein [unclassified Flavobacterium]RKR11003.1 heme-binding HmuY-like protein [Flavobacterium sp. 81]TCK54786.1 heme-binding HmuY-like protein [Flavobacterium sp. 90]